MPSWLDYHVETFIKTHLGKVPNVNKNDIYVKGWTPKRVKALQAVWAQAKRRSEGLPILLAGRDVFLLELLARLEGYPTTFRQDISSSTAKIVCYTDDYSKYYCVDTGYSGSVPIRLGCGKWDLISYNPYNGGALGPKEDHMLFPWSSSCGVVRSLATTLEGVPKYWMRAECGIRNYFSMGPHQKEYYTIKQSLADPTNFHNAAVITLHIAGMVGAYNPTKKVYILPYVANDKYYSIFGAQG